MTTSRIFTAIAIITALVACILGLSVPMANAAEPAYGTAVVDGNMGEWITDPLAPDTDFFAYMYVAGNPVPDEPKAMLCLRYDCVGKTLYTLVVPPDGMADVYADPDFAFILIDGAWGSLEGTGMYVGLGNPLPSDATAENTISGSPVTTWGWEASFPLEPGTHTITVFNCNATTYEFVSTDLVTDPYGLALNLVCVGGTTGTGTGTPGYWKNHLEAWPQNGITIGETSYGVYEAIAIMDTPGKGDRTYTMFRALVAAKLNVWNGCDSSCIVSTIVAADEWMTQYGPVGSGVDGKSTAWADGEPLATMLDDYNNGLLCAPARE